MSLEGKWPNMETMTKVTGERGAEVGVSGFIQTVNYVPQFLFLDRGSVFSSTPSL